MVNGISATDPSAAPRRSTAARPWHWFKDNLKKARGRPLRHILRGACNSIWPFSVFMHLYYRIRFGPAYGLINKQSAQLFESARPELDSVGRAALDTLQRDGVFASHVEELIPSITLERIQNEARRLIERPRFQAQLASQKSLGHKSAIVRAFGFAPGPEIPELLLEVFLGDRLLDIVNSYQGKLCRLSYLDLWYSLPNPSGKDRSRSASWHRDIGDRHILRATLHVSDVTEDSGPFTYQKGTQLGGDLADIAVFHPGFANNREEAAAEQVPADRIETFTGRAGSLVLSDNSGFHRGGEPVGDPRIVFVANYVSNAGLARNTYRPPPARSASELDMSARYALRLKL